MMSSDRRHEKKKKSGALQYIEGCVKQAPPKPRWGFWRLRLIAELASGLRISQFPEVEVMQVNSLSEQVNSLSEQVNSLSEQVNS
jgi:hypothetical protein